MLNIYLETTIFNFPFADDAPQYRDATIMLWQQIKDGLFAPYTSDYVIEELLNAKDDLRQKRLDLVKKYNVTVFPKNEQIEILAKKYVLQGVIPQSYVPDANHIACCSFYNLDVIVSLNFRHIVKRKTILACEAINALCGYRKVEIYTPQEVINYVEGL